jgi:comEA protein
MGTSPQVYSSVSGPAKWAAVVVLTALCSAGLTYSLMREERRPRSAGGQVRELPARGGVAGAPKVAAPRPAAVEKQKDVDVGPVAVTAPAPAAVEQAAEEPAVGPESPVAPVVSELEPQPETPAAPSVARRININTAVQAELELLPQVGPLTAKAIIAHRSLHGPFRSVAELDKVKGIGPKTLEKLAALVTVD